MTITTVPSRSPPTIGNPAYQAYPVLRTAFVGLLLGALALARLATALRPTHDRAEV